MTNPFFCRLMCTDDLVAVLQIQSEAYVADMVESAEVFAARLAQAPDTAWVVEGAQGVCGYLMGYLSIVGSVTPLGSDFFHKPDGDHLYLHDLAISPSAVGCGLGPLLVNHALQQVAERRLSGAALVSVQDSRGFWERLGFSEFFQLAHDQYQNLASYSGRALYMTRNF